MIKKNVVFVVLLFSSFVCGVVNAVDFNDGFDVGESQATPFIVENTEVHKVISTIVPDQVYDLYIALPGSYHHAQDKEYPIIVVLDGQWDFELVRGITGRLAFDGMMPEAIVAAVSWGGEGDEPAELRWRDFIRQDDMTGANLFLSALTQELVPYLESQFRVGDRRVLMGSSIGGLFTTYAMLENPGYFDGYIASEGSYFRDQEYLSEKLASLSGTNSLYGVRSFLGAGSLQNELSKLEDVKEMTKQIKLTRLEGFKNKTKVFKGFGHGGVAPITFSNGLQYVFKRPALKLSEEFLQQYAGVYEGGIAGEPDTTITVEVAGRGQIVIGENTFFADSPSTFYVKGLGLTATFNECGELVMDDQEELFHFNLVTQ